VNHNLMGREITDYGGFNQQGSVLKEIAILTR